MFIYEKFASVEKCIRTISSKSQWSDELENKTNIEILAAIEQQHLHDDLDDFRNMLDFPAFKIIAGIFGFVLITFTNVFLFSLSMFEKYGGDPLKRSLKNQIIIQFGYAMMLNNLICTPCLIWRIIFGPIYTKIAVFDSFIENISVTWMFLILTQTFVIKALMLFKFSHMAGLDDTFMARFLLLSNLGFAILTHGIRYLTLF